MQPAAAFGVAPTCAGPCEPSADTKVIELDDIPDTQIDPVVNDNLSTTTFQRQPFIVDSRCYSLDGSRRRPTAFPA